MNSLRTKTDHELIHSFRDGDLQALEALVIRHKDKLYTSILFLVKDKYLAEDIFQDVLIKIIDTIRGGRYTEEGKFLPWADAHCSQPLRRSFPQGEKNTRH
ncbi:MAG: hypothetical protein WDM78_23745 [Puia sp.]